MDRAWLNEWNVGMKLCTGHFPIHGAWPTVYPAMNYTPPTNVLDRHSIYSVFKYNTM